MLGLGPPLCSLAIARGPLRDAVKNLLFSGRLSVLGELDYYRIFAAGPSPLETSV